MRRVDGGVDSQSGRGRKRDGAQTSRSTLRRLALEGLEARTLLSTLPTPVAQGQFVVGDSQSGQGNSSSPSVAVDPLNPEKLVSAWVVYDPGHKLDGGNGQVTTYVEGGYSTDGGQTWQPLPNTTGNGTGLVDADIQTDFSVAPPSSGPQPNFAQTTDATVAFGRDESVYLLTSTHSGTGGVLDLQRWDFSTDIPAPQTFTVPAYDGLTNAPTTINPIYRWQAADAALTPTLAVDNNLASFPVGSATPTQTDKFAGNVYVAWETQDAAPKNVTQNPNTIKLMSSSDQGQDFTYQAYLNSHATGHLYDQPKIAISQGSSAVQGGQVTIVYDDAGLSTTAPFFDQIETKASDTGGTDEHFDTGPNPTPIVLATAQASPSTTDNIGVTTIPIPVNISDPGSLQNLTLTLSLQYPTLGNTSAVLEAPDGTTVTLWNEATNAAGTAVNAGSSLAGANMGASAEGPYIGTVLDSTANRSLFDGNVAAPYTGHFAPLASFNPVTRQLVDLQTAFQGRTAGQLNDIGLQTWNLVITTYRTETATTPKQLIGASLDFTFGNSDITSNPQNFVDDAFLNSGAHTYTGSGIQTGAAAAILASPSIASDNTLGSNSPHQGRLYIAFTNDDYSLAAGNPYTNSTYIQLYYSDNGGLTWIPDTTDAITGVQDGIVNDDNGLKDGFSTGGFAQPNSGTGGNGVVEAVGEANVRPKLEPQVAVDPDTGTVVVSFLDTRNDAAGLRVATYIAASTDGGSTFAPETYANASNPLSTLNPNYGLVSGAPYGIPTITTDAITGLPVNLGPIPDNESGGNAGSDGTFGFGQRQGLAVENGHIIPLWSSNQNGTTLYAPTPSDFFSNPTYVGAEFFSNAGSNARNEKPILNIESAVLTFAAGPRVIASTQGPVGEPGDTVNTSRAADGSPIANTIQITFDRAVDPTSFPADGLTNPIGTSPLQVFYNNPGGNPPAFPNGIPLRVLSVMPVVGSGDTVYTITFDPAGHGVGSYSYTLMPLVKGMIPYQAILDLSATVQVPFIETGFNGSQSSFTVSGHPGTLLTSATIAAQVDIFRKGVSTGSPTDLQIFLVANDGTRYLLYNTTTQGRNFFNVNSSITIPALPAQLLDQAYSILLVDNVPNEGAFLFDNSSPDDSFPVTLNNQAAEFLSFTGNFLDQDANGTPGVSPDDDYSVPNGRDSLPLIVPGPHVVTTTVTGVNGVVGTPSTPSNDSVKLVNNDNVNSINVTFDREMQVSSFTPAQILSIVGPTGPISTPQVFPSTGTSRSFAYNGPALLIPKAGTLTSTIPIAATGLDVSKLTVQVNITDPNDQSLQLVLMAPDGTIVPLVNAGAATGANFTNTTFSDAPAANGQTSTIAGGAAPYSLTYLPAIAQLATLSGKVLDGNWKLLVTDSTGVGTAQGRLNSWSLNVTPQVPTGPGTQLNSTLVVASYPDNSFKIGHLAVQLNISSTLDSDLQVFLVAPNGTTVIPLILNAGGTGANFTNTIFDDGATIPIASGVAPFGLTYRPAGDALTPAVPLSTLDGLSIEGTWTLRIVSANADVTASTLNSWSLIATPQLTVTPVNPTVDPTTGDTQALTFTIGFPTQDLSGNYNITLSPNIVSVAANPANPSQGTPLDTDLNAGVGALRGTSTGVFTPVLYTAASVPVAIPYATTVATGKIDGVLTSQINVPDNFAIQGDLNNDTLAGLTVSLNIGYYNDPDLTVTLTAPGPNGKTVTLFSNVGKGANTANFTNTTLSDTVNPPAPITAAGAPFFATFNPEGSLAAFATLQDGVTQAFSQGLWTLTITNIGLDPGSTIDSKVPPALLGWSLNFQKPQVSTGLGEPVADQKTVGFRLFNLAPTDPLANDTWTAVGPAGTAAATNPNAPIGSAANGANLAGPVSVVAIDPSDPSGNTAYIGASSGGIWKTTDFLTADPSGPTYIPLTDFGANYAINIGGIAIFDQNNDPNQSIIFAGTGNAQATTANAGNSVQGVGFLRSTNGGASFTLLDSSTNVDANGNPLPINSPLRDHMFVGTTTYKIIVDPTAQPGLGLVASRVIVYAALGGPHGGLWRSLDGGNHWTNLSASVPAIGNAAATDVLLDPASASTSTGNLDILYAAFMGVGVFISSSQGQALTEVLGNVGADNLIRNSQIATGAPLTVNDANPNGAFGRIILAKPALTDSASENILYQDWLYAAVENANGTFRGLYVTKDRGENWTLAQIANDPTPTPGDSLTVALPTNDNKQANNYDVTNPSGGNGSGGGFNVQNGNSAFSMTIDPLDPNIIYLGGTQNYQDSGLIRVDLTGLYDAHAYVPFASDLNDAGTLARDATGRVNVAITMGGDPLYEGTSPASDVGGYYLNLRHSPTDPFSANSTLFVYNSSSFTNSGIGVAWEPIDQVYGSPLDGSTNIHQLLTVVDPLTGLTRLIIADDQGVFTGLYNADGSLNTSGIGTLATVTGSRNGNLQDEEIYYSAAQPSTLAAQAAGALFYGSGIGMTDVTSPSDLLSTGNLTWTVQGPGFGDLQGLIETNDRGGTGIATDATGGVSASNPNGKPSLYQYDVPLLGGDTTNFFRVQNNNGPDNGSTTGLTNNYQTAWPGTNVLSQGNGVSQLGNFAVNPINGLQILISSNLGDVFETTNQGSQWLMIGSGTGSFDGTYAPALAYGAPDPGAPNGIGNLNNFIYVGTVGGNIYVTQTGAGPWTKLSGGLDGSSVVSIFTNPNRGSHEAYAVTLKGVYYMADSVASATNPNPTWVNITGNLTQIQHNSFGDPTLAQNALLGYNGTQLGGFSAIVADYRYAVPTTTSLATTVVGPAAGPSILPSVASNVTVSGNPPGSVLTFGTVTFNITIAVTGSSTPLAPDAPYTIELITPDGSTTVLNTGIATGGVAGSNQTVSLTVPFSAASSAALYNGQYSLAVVNSKGATITINSWSLALNAQSVTNHPVLYASGYGGVFRSLDNGQTWTAFPNTAFDSAPVDGGYLPNVSVTSLQLNLGAINPATGHPTEVTGDPEVLLASTLGRGDFAIRLAPDVFPSTIALDPTHPAPGGSATGAVNGNPLLTNITLPFISGTSEISNFGNRVTISLIDQTPGPGFGQVIGTGYTDAFGHFSVQVGTYVDSTMFNDPSFLLSGVKNVGVQATDSSGAMGHVTVFTYTLAVNAPANPTNLTLTNDSGRSATDRITNLIPPIFTVATAEPSTTKVELYRLVSTPAGNVYELVDTQAAGTPNGVVTLTDTKFAADNPGLIDSLFTYFALQIDQAGNPSTPLTNIGSDPTSLTITVDNTPPPAPPAPTLDPNSNTSLVPGQVTTSKTNPVFDLSGLAPNVVVALIRTPVGGTPIVVGVQFPVAGVDPTTITDTVGLTTDGTYTYQVQQVDLAGNFSVFSPGLSLAAAVTPPLAPTIGLLPADDSGLPTHPNVTNVTTPHFTGAAQFNATPANFPVDILAGEAAFSTRSVPLNPNGVIFSPSTGLTVPAGQQAVAGYVTITISNKSATGGGGGNLGNLAVELIGPGGQTYYLPRLTNATSLTLQNFNLPASFLTGVLSGAYSLAVADFTPGDVGQITSWSVTLLNGNSSGPTVLASTFPSASFTYSTQITTPLANGSYILVARSRNLAGSPSYSPPLPITIKTAGSQVVPTLALLPADDTGIKGDGVTADHTPSFTGTADPGATVNIYALINGQLVGPVNLPTTASTVNGSFTAQLSSNLTNGATTLFARSIDIANNPGPYSAPFNVRITTVTGDYNNTGAAQFTIFDPNTETYFTLGGVAASVDSGSHYGDIPVQYDFNGDGFTDYVAYHYSTATYIGQVSPSTPYSQGYGAGNNSLPAAGAYGPGGTFLLGNYGPSSAFYVVSYPQPFAGTFVVANLDVPVPAAYNGNGVAEIAVFRPSAVAGALGTAASDADSFSVGGPQGYYQVSFTSPAVTKLGFVYQAGDIPAPADYDGVGHDEFAIYRPSTGQFFILNTPNSYNSATWTLRTVSLNLPGGPNVNDVPASEDYDGNGKIDPTVYRPSNSTFYVIHSSTGLQQNIPFGLGGFDIAAAGPLLYRLTALKPPGGTTPTDGYTPGLAGLPKTGAAIARSTLSAQSIVSAATSSASSSTPVPATVAVAAPLTVVSTPTPTPTTVSVSLSASSAPSAKIAVTIGASAPTLFVPTVAPTELASAVTARDKAAKPKKPVKAVTVEAKARHVAETKPQAAHPKVKAAPARPHVTAAATMKHVVSAKKGQSHG